MMEAFNRKNHWENIYQTKKLNEVSWYQPTPETSLELIHDLEIPKNAKIIDIGGGDGFWVDHLLALGYQDITVLDISAAAIDRAKSRLVNKAHLVKWIVEDINAFMPTEIYDFWHDRACFHFLNQAEEQLNYVELAYKSLNPNGKLVMGTFSDQGPKKCSGIEIQQYSEATLTQLFAKHFEKIECFTLNHTTPFDTLQNFIFCSFQKKEIGGL